MSSFSTHPPSLFFVDNPPFFINNNNNDSFRRITYYPDRPDNMAIFDSVRIEANKSLYPILLSNGNKIDEGTVVITTDDNNDNDNDEVRHYATWSDPYPKPSYLFCIVAGDLKSISSSYTTRPSGREVHLEVYSEPENVGKLGHALESLKKSMMWDEDNFGLEYDLDIYNIVAVSDFNMGAMEVRELFIMYSQREREREIFHAC